MISAIILAGGTGSRMKSNCPKQFLPLGEKFVLQHSVELFLFSSIVDEIIVVLASEYRSRLSYDGLLFADPGMRRQDSVANGLSQISSSSQYVLVHDSARPLIQLKDIKALITEGKKTGVAALAVPVKSTMREAKENGFATRTLPRDRLWEIQTPQFLEKKILIQGMNKALREEIEVTDDVALAEIQGHEIKLVQGSYCNFKITTAEDLPIAEMLYRHGKV